MKNSIDDIDALIKETLTKEEAEFYDSLEAQGLLGMVGDLFRSKLKWILIIMNVVQVLSFIAFIYCTVQFFQTEIVAQLIQWGAGAFLFLFMSSFLKLFSWMQMDKNALLREIKRLELQISSLSSKIS